jgi:deoxycytidylate deaminase
MAGKFKVYDELESGGGGLPVVIPNPVPDNSTAWAEFIRKLNPRWRRAAELGFAEGKIGHRCRPLTAKEQRLLMWAIELHPGLIFSDDEGRTIGVHICPCAGCAQRVGAFVMETGVEMHAQQKGDYHYTRVSDTEVKMEPSARSAYEDLQELRTVALAGATAKQVAEQVTEAVRTEVSRQLRSFFAEQTKTVIRNQNRNSLIQSAFQQQADMLRSDPENEVQ